MISTLVYLSALIKAIKCSLRNDMLEIWDKCKEGKAITSYQLQAFEYSFVEYKKLRGNSFVDDIHERIKSFEILD